MTPVEAMKLVAMRAALATMMWRCHKVEVNDTEADSEVAGKADGGKVSEAVAEEATADNGGIEANDADQRLWQR